jgi:hypothetical protein
VRIVRIKALIKIAFIAIKEPVAKQGKGLSEWTWPRQRNDIMTPPEPYPGMFYCLRR